MEKASMVLRYEPESVSPVLVYMWHVKGVFRERMELQHFPFDVQELSVVISSDLPLEFVDLMEDPNYDSSVNLGALQESEEWVNYRHIEFVHDVMKREMESSNKHPVLVASAHAKRKLGSYFWNVGIIVFLILALTFTLLSIDPMINDRLAIIMTLFLTAVAFKLVVRSSLPSISYLTYLIKRLKRAKNRKDHKDSVDASLNADDDDTA
ncbi:gamma-aminobutyric acid receptor subunit gamma-2 [Elysia marginata]|uniref:Gamma-aminobutyric acid receptor subunit gamma-2 n=1 Tax=Elysia marginata TaxID=1093978 RepID=A0AAV4J2U1_9GAST|nr:gamma-aminobutyric acid receptor subunit gamma-2 [Elysia marginata]